MYMSLSGTNDKNIQIIVADGGSTDKTIQIVEVVEGVCGLV